MTEEIKIKLQDLANIALGSPQLTNDHIAILKILVEILLKKLDCQNETVRISADNAKHFENLLENSKVNPTVFNDQNTEAVSETLERLKKLQAKVNELDDKLDGHLVEVNRKSNLAEPVLEWEKWINYGCEHLCTTCDPENDMACKLLKNTDFIKKLMRRMSAPIVERMFYFEQKIEQLNEEFTIFIKRPEGEYQKIYLLEKCIVEIEKLHNIMKQQHTQFISTMEEIQDMLDSKLDKIHMPALKKYITENFQQIDQSINTLQDKQKCHRAAGIIMKGVCCLSCGDAKVCSEVGVQPASMLPDVIIKAPRIRKYCGTAQDLKSSKNLTSWNLADGILVGSKAAAKRDSEEPIFPTCHEADKAFEFLEGSSGQLYRKG